MQPGATSISDISALSLRARLALALRLFAGYCDRRGLVHPEISAYLDHLWRFLAVGNAGEGFEEWISDRTPLLFAGLGDEYPPDFEAFLAARTVSEREFRQALGCTTEVLYGSMYAAADEPGSREFLGELAKLVAAFGVEFPDTRPFLGSRWSDGHGWGAQPTPEELITWRAPSPE